MPEEMKVVEGELVPEFNERWEINITQTLIEQSRLVKRDVWEAQSEEQKVSYIIINTFYRNNTKLVSMQSNQAV